MTTRTYDESCALAHGLDLIGDRWALLVVRELMFGPRRFTDIQTRLAGASSSALADRLRDLVEIGVATRRRLPAPAASWVYELTDWGASLQPAMMALASWGRRSPHRDGTLTTTPAAIAMAMLIHFDPGRAGDLDAQIDLDLDGDRFRAGTRGGVLRITAPDDRPADAVIQADARSMKALIGSKRPTSIRGWSAVGITITGDAARATKLLDSLAA